MIPPDQGLKYLTRDAHFQISHHPNHMSCTFSIEQQRKNEKPKFSPAVLNMWLKFFRQTRLSSASVKRKVKPTSLRRLDMSQPKCNVAHCLKFNK